MNTLVAYRKRQVITPEAAALLRDGQRKHRYYELMEEKGVLEKPILKSKIKYDEYAPNSTTIPTEAERILNEVVTNHPVKQVVIGHEIVEKPEKKKVNVDQWVGVVRTIMVVIAAIYLLPFTLLALLFVYDPQLIVVLDDGRKTWIEIARWDELSE